MEYLETSKRRWPDADVGPWTLETRYLPVSGRWELVGLCLEPVDASDPSPLTTTLLRKIVPAQLATEHRRGMKLLVAGPGVGGSPAAIAAVLRRSSAGDPDRKKVGRRRYWSADRLAKIAHVYSNAWWSGDNPTKAVEAAFHISHSLAGKLVGQCRITGDPPLLPKTQPGKPRGAAEVAS